MGHLILNVDDFEPQRYARSALLRAAGFDVIEAATGGDAIALAKAHRPQLVLLDVHLPDIDGLEVCRQLKAAASDSVPLVLHVSATFRDAGSRARALDNGADAYLAEPVEADEVVAEVRALLRLAHAEAAARSARQALRDSEDRYRTLVESSPDGLLIDSGGIVAYANPAARRQFAADAPDRLLGQESVSLFHPDCRPAVFARLDAVRRGEELPPLEARVLRFDGTAGEVEMVAAPCRYDGRSAIHIVMHDITDRKQFEEALRASEAEIASLYDSAPIGLCILDRDGRYVRVNRRLAEINGQPSEAHLGRTLRQVVPKLADQIEPILKRVLDTGQPAVNLELSGYLQKQPEVERNWIENWFPVLDGEGHVVGVNVAVQEITHQKAVERELREANRVKEEFLATLSHELRTPLTAILGWSHMLARGTLDEPTRKQAIEAIARNAESQRQLIADVLDTSRMLSGKLRLDLRVVDLKEVAVHASASIRPTLDVKGIRLRQDWDETPAPVTADPARLQQIIWNLLSNAVKFTPADGTITVAIGRSPDGFHLTVADDGAGIRREFLPHVFDRFAQADGSMSRRHSGLGLGLSIVRQLVELHGGHVVAASEGEGHGATFTVSLPARSGGSTSPTAPTAGQRDRCLAGVSLLIVDDMEDTRHLVAQVVEGAGGHATLAASGEEALAEVAVHRPDIVLADLGMPGMDGFEFLRRLRSLDPAEGGTIPVIAVTAYGSAGDRQRTLSAGFAEHLGKPMMPDELVAAICRIVDRYSIGR